LRIAVAVAVETPVVVAVGVGRLAALFRVVMNPTLWLFCFLLLF
jgi:hypothetical protein